MNETFEQLVERVALETTTSQKEFDKFWHFAARLRDELVKQQEPVATLHDDGCFTWKSDEFRRLYDRERAGWRMDVYASPPAAEPLSTVPVAGVAKESGNWNPHGNSGMRYPAQSDLTGGETDCGTKAKVVWKLEEALSFIRSWQPIFMEAGFYLALAGGVLNKGFSTSDLDLVAMPRTIESKSEAAIQLLKPYVVETEPVPSGIWIRCVVDNLPMELVVVTPPQQVGQ